MPLASVRGMQLDLLATCSIRSRHKVSGLERVSSGPRRIASELATTAVGISEARLRSARAPHPGALLSPSQPYLGLLLPISACLRRLRDSGRAHARGGVPLLLPFRDSIAPQHPGS